MQANELRVNNWVAINDYQNQVAGIFPNNRILIDKIVFEIDIIKPVPLTEEWLLRFGFSDNGYKKGFIGIDFKSGQMTLDFVLSKPLTKGEWNNTYTFDLEGSRFVPIEFVHQLQNLFYALTFTELEITPKTMDVKKQQQDLIDSIKSELAKERKFNKPSSFKHSIWFCPTTGGFLYDDRCLKDEIVRPLIEAKIIVFKGMETHQGEKMLRYILSNQ